MNVKLVREGSVVCLIAQGRLDLKTLAPVQEEVRRCLVNGDLKLVLDLAAVECVSSSGLRSLVMLLHEVRVAHGHLVLCALTPEVKDLFEITQPHKIFDLYSSRREASNALMAMTPEGAL